MAVFRRLAWRVVGLAVCQVLVGIGQSSKVEQRCVGDQKGWRLTVIDDLGLSVIRKRWRLCNV
jgi:hypothetical protein